VTDDIIALLKVHEYFRGMPDEVLHDVLRLARVTYHAAGDVVHEANALVTTVGFVLRGKLKAVRVDDRGKETLFRMVERGGQFGMMVGAVSEPVPIRVIAKRRWSCRSVTRRCGVCGTRPSQEASVRTSLARPPSGRR
jgi:signal-transduction protein with cAMP-binding, CBS, and nucleotidyltransferase domain